jgi:hypothetical protein
MILVADQLNHTHRLRRFTPARPPDAKGAYPSLVGMHYVDESF